MTKVETKSLKRILFAVVPLLSAVSAYAGSVTFSFDAQNGVAGLASGATNANIQTYMNAVLTAAGCAGCSVTVTGAVADQTYNGEGHVTGPGVSPSKSLTLGTSDGATASNTTSTVNANYDTFIANTNDSSGNISSLITMKFNGFTGLAVNSFDYEVFPDGTCAQLNSTNCGGSLTGGHYPNQPDLIFQAGNSAAPNGTDPVVSTFWGVTPGTTNGTATDSPIAGSPELAPQAIGTWTTGISGVTSLDFVDWPATIGVDNLKVSWNTPVPEPVSVFLLGTVAAGLLLRKKLRKT